MSKKILVTGGTGYIGSHTVVELINAGYDVEILDNLFNSKIEVLDKIKEITGTKPKVHQVDLLFSMARILTLLSILPASKPSANPSRNHSNITRTM